MKRILIFCTLGTILAIAGVIVISADWKDQYFASMAIGIAERFAAPALLVMYLLSVLDKALAPWGWQRVAACAAAGYVGVALIQIVYDKNPSFVFPLASAIPAAACSWLSSTNQGDREIST